MRETKNLPPNFWRATLAVLALALVTAAAAFPWLRTQAQHRSNDPAVNVTGITLRPSGGGEVVSITADAPLAQAQTWSDEEGFHVVGYRWQSAFGGAPRGVNVRRVGGSLEIVIAARAGAGVTVLPRGNSLDVIVSGGVARAATDAAEPRQRARKVEQAESKPAGGRQGRSASADEGQLAVASSHARAARQLKSAQTTAQPAHDAVARTGQARSRQGDGEQSQATQDWAAQTPSGQDAAQPSAAQKTAAQKSGAKNSSAQSPQPGASQQGAQQQAQYQAGQQQPQGQSQQNQPPQDAVAQQGAASVPLAAATPLLASAAQPVSDGGSLSFGFTVVGVFLGVGLVVFLFLFLRAHRRGGGAVEVETNEDDVSHEAAAAKRETSAGAKGAASKSRASGDGATNGKKENKVERTAAKVEASGALVKREAKPGASSPSFASAPAVLFGAFRVEQEVDNLVRGMAHAVEVLASRAADDRRAVEASLLKALASPELSDAERSRARGALEEYGFVARQSAAVLLAPDAYERSSAARALGQIKSAASLPFLLEALYDADTVVRTEAVASLGTLGLPRAIGALLDTARRHPEIPASLVTRALNACSVEAVEFDSLVEDFGGGGGDFSGDIMRLEPVAEVEHLPEWLEDEVLADALERLAADDVEVRVAAAQQLSQFQVKPAVNALAAMAADDKDASVRAAAITSLGMINHESVFASVLIAMADESREVRAAAARALSRLCFDRADAYVRLLETADAETLERTAEACVTAGLARQAMDRLASEDRRQAYEAFSLLSLVVRGGQSDVLVSVVRAHPDLSVRLASARLLALQGDESVSDRLRQIAMEGTTPEKLREAILEFCERRRQPRDGSPASHENAAASPTQPAAPSSFDGESPSLIGGDKSAQPIA